MSIIVATSYKEDLEFTLPTSAPQEPTDVLKFVYSAMKILTTVFKSNEKEDANIWLEKMYMRAILDGKKFKESIPTKLSNSTDFQDVTSDPSVGNFVQYGREIHIKEELFCVVIRGTADDKDTRSRIEKVGEKSNVLIVTYKLFQAIISIMICIADLQSKVECARLCANVMKACTEENAAQEKYNWGIHGHSGINFVARYMKQVVEAKSMEDLANKAGKKKSDYVPKDKYAKLYKNSLPPLHALIMMAIRMDAAADSKQSDKKKRGHAQTLTNLCQTAGISKDQVSGLMKRIDPKKWGKEVTSDAKSVAQALMDSIKAKEKKKDPRNKPSDDEEEGSEEEGEGWNW